MRMRWVLALSLSILILVSGGCAFFQGGASSGFNNEFNSIVQPYSFNFATWELKAFLNQVQQRIVNGQPDAALNSQAVVRYFSYIIMDNTLKSDLQMVRLQKMSGDVNLYQNQLAETETQINNLKPEVEQTIARQITETLSDLGIYNPFDNSWFKLTFPPINFKLEKPLYELVISPRDRIQRLQSITIKPDITGSQIEEVESSVDKLNVSALVVQIGGLGATYPSFVVNNADLRFTLDTAAHEWLHQYLAFKPLGFRYVLDLLGISKNYEIDTINETVASIFGQEVGALIYNKYYSQYKNAYESKSVSQSVAPGFDFNAAMRNIRKTVDDLLAKGQVDQAENYMNDQQKFLSSKGYYIRKLNQAYFAFYGTYADGPTSIDPIGMEIRQLRDHSPSLKAFIVAASDLKNKQDLSQLVSQYR